MIELYGNLAQKEQDRCRKSYISCEYNFSKIWIERLWKETLTSYLKSIAPWNGDPNFSNWSDRNSTENQNRREIIGKCKRYLEDVTENIPESDTVESVQNKNKIRFTELDYRKAQLLNIQGMLCRIVGFAPEKIDYFRQAAELLKEMFRKAESLRNQGARFNYPWYAIPPYALAEFANGHYRKAGALLLSVPADVRPYGYYIAARNLLSRMLPYFPVDMLCGEGRENRHAIVKHLITEDMKEKLRTVGFVREKVRDLKVAEIYDQQESIGYSEFLRVLAEVFYNFVRWQSYPEQQKHIKVLRSVAAEYTHYKPEFDDLLATPEDRLIALIDLGVRKSMMPSTKRSNFIQQKINTACVAVFEKEMTEAIQKAANSDDL